MLTDDNDSLQPGRVFGAAFAMLQMLWEVLEQPLALNSRLGQAWHLEQDEARSCRQEGIWKELSSKPCCTESGAGQHPHVLCASNLPDEQQC